MPLSWSTYCFLPYFIVTFSSSADKTPCNKTIYETLKYCGNLDMYRKFNKNSSFAFDYKYFGGYCYAYSSDFHYGAELGISEAQERCEQDGAQLPEFKTRMDWEEYLRGSKHTKNHFNWLGAEASGGKCTWLKSNKEIKIGNIEWGATPPKTAERKCIIQQGEKWFAFRCETKRPYFCQKHGKEAYEGKATLTINAQGRDGSIKLKDGDSVKVSCSARSERKMIISVQMKDSVLFSVHDEGKKDRTMNGISFSDIQTKFTYYYDYLRCFQHVHLTMTVELSRKLVGAQILCTRRMADEEMAWLVGLGASQGLVFKTKPQGPEETTVFILWYAAMGLLGLVLLIITYSCYTTRKGNLNDSDTRRSKTNSTAARTEIYETGSSVHHTGSVKPDSTVTGGDDLIHSAVSTIVTDQPRPSSEAGASHL